MENSKTEVVYTKAKPGRRMLAHVMDIGIFLFMTIILFTVSNIIVRNSSSYVQSMERLAQIKNESGIFTDNVIITTYVQDNTKFPNTTDKKEYLRKGIDYFYHNPTYFDDIAKQMEVYDKRRLDSLLFERNAEDQVVEKNVDVQQLYTFYKSEVDDRAVVLLLNNLEYVSLSRISFIAALIEIIVSATLSFIIFYYIVPAFIFRRGRQTIGMKLSKIGLITIHAVNETLGIYTLRAVFMFFVFIPINFVSFMIPTFVSITMMYVNKTNSSLVNYVFNDYMVDITAQDIYLNDLERIEAQESLKQASLENKDYRLK